MAEGIVSTVAAPVIENSINAIGRQFGYLWNYRKNMANLEKQVMILGNKISDMSRFVTAAERNAEEIGDDVQGWLSEAKDISARERKFLEEHAKKGKKKCLIGLCPNLVSRHQFSKSAWKKEMDVVDAIAREGQIIKVSFRPVGQESTIMSTAGCFTFDSRKSIMEDIMKVLQDETKRMVGVYGLGGMGKTTLAKQVASQAKEEKLFEEVVFASVTQNVDMKEIQGQLASMLDLKLDESTVAERANRVHQRLKRKKVLVILEDLWKELYINEVGVSLGCKILLTSRYKHVLTSMGTEEDFNVGELGEDDAWRLFEEKTYKVVKNPDFHNIGKEIVQKCRGWPVLIVMIAASLSKRPQLPAWNDALNQLRNMNNKDLLHIVNSAIESISYNHLEKTHKRLFLLCGATCGVASIEDLLQYGWGLDLFEEEAMTIQEARDRLHNLIIDLKDSCLLLDDVDSRNSIKMHDVVRDVAISIGKKNSNMFSMGAELKTWPKDVDLNKCTAMVLRACPNLSVLPSPLECPSLELFVMSCYSLSIPEAFFEKTSKLKVLGMSKFRSTSLPKSLSFLTNLQTLRLNGCHSLKDVSVVGELKTLETLSFANSGIEELPSGIGNLLELRLLDMRGCYRLKVIPAGLIQGLSQLQELYVDHNFIRWEADVCVNDSIITNGSLRELEHLPNLCSLGIRVGDIKLLPEHLNFEKLKRYEIIVGDMWWIKELQVTTTICVQLSTTSINQFEHGVKMLFKITQCLCLGELKDIENVVPTLDGDGFPNLKHLHIRKDDDIQYVVNVKDTRHNVVFSSLESLQLIELMKLQKLCNGPLIEPSFYNLITLKVEKCNGLKSLFSFSMATKLPKLQKIEVSFCGVLEEIVGEKNINDDEVCEKIEFAQVRILYLYCLPKLNKFFNSWEMQNKSQKCLRSDSSDCQEIHEEEEDELISSLPFFKKVSFPNLQELALVELSHLKEIWSHKEPESYCNLTRLEISNCDNLNYLMTPLVAMGLVGLRHLTVSNCANMKHVVAKEEGDTNTVTTITFPQLSSLYLDDLDNLTTFYSSVNFNSATQPLFIEKVSLPKLQELTVRELSNLTHMWTHIESESYCNLTSLEIYKCDNLKYLMTPLVAMGLVCLQNLIVKNCASMKHVVAKEEGDTNTVAITFPLLSSVHLEDLDNLTTFYSSDKLDIVTQPLFSEKVLFLKLHDLYLYEISNMGEIWNQKLQVTPCHDLTRLTIRQCKSLKQTTKSRVLVPKGTYNTMSGAKGVDECGKLSTFDFLSFPEKQGDALSEKVRNPLVFQVMSNLKNMRITSSDMMKIMRLYDHNLSPHLFPSLEYLQISEFHDESIVFPSKFLSIIHSQLRSFEVFNCFFQEIFPFEREDIHDDILFPQLHTLTLQKLSELKYIYKQDQCSSFILNVLERLHLLHVEECHRLTNLVPSSVFFRSLTSLIVKDCGGLTNLIQSSTARSLGHLIVLMISGCNMMETVIGDGGEESLQDGDEFIFTNLQQLELEKLPKLTNFCSSPDHAFNFPNLWDVSVRECPNMKTFCGGIPTTTRLGYICYEEERRREGDLNATIQQSFAKRKAKRLPTVLPSTSLNNHVEANALFPDNSSEELIYPRTEVQSCPKESENSTDSRRGTETCEEVVEEGKEGGVCVKASAPHIPDKGKGKEVEVSQKFTDHSDKLSNHSQFDQHSEKAAENCEEMVERGRKQVDICAQHAVPSSSTSSSSISSSNNNSEVEAQLHYKTAEKVSNEPITECQICENGAEMSANMEAHKLASTGHFEAAAQLLEGSAKAEKTADTFEEGSLASRYVVASSSCLSPPVTNLRAQTTLSLFPELEDHKSTPIIPSTSLDAEDSIPMSKFVQILQTQAVSNVSAEQVQFVEDTIGSFHTYVVKAKQCLERKKAISELKRQMQALEQENEAVASSAHKFGSQRAVSSFFLKIVNTLLLIYLCCGLTLLLLLRV